MTPEIKDKVLDYIITHGGQELNFSGNAKTLAVEFETTHQILNEIFNQFHKRGFVNYRPFSGWDFLIDIKAGAYDYYGMGGHVGEFRMLEMQVTKLQSELLALEKQFGKEPLRDLATTANTLISFFQAVYHR